MQAKEPEQETNNRKITVFEKDLATVFSQGLFESITLNFSMPFQKVFLELIILKALSSLEFYLYGYLLA